MLENQIKTSLKTISLILKKMKQMKTILESSYIAQKCYVCLKIKKYTRTHLSLIR